MNFAPGALGVLLIGTLACGGAREQSEDIFVQLDSIDDPTVMENLPPVPAFPTGRRGYLAAASAGEFRLGGSWKARATLCRERGLLEIDALVPGTGTLILVRLKTDSVAGSYVITEVDQDVPESGEARIGLQVFRGKVLAYAFQAESGELDISSLGEHVSGRFTSVVREIETDILTRYVGVIDRVPVDTTARAYCAKVSDSFWPNPDSTADSSGLH
ncbi:MAG: hypothetical protein ACE5HT_12820 [Gemmatimonadales bacterium]